MTSFQVEIDALASVHDALNGVHATLAQTPSTTSQYEGQLGSSDLEGDLHRFFGDWSDYWNKMEGNISSALTALANALQGYSDTEKAIQQAAMPQAAAGTTAP